MPLFNPLEFLLYFDFTRYIFVAFATLGIVLCVKKLVLRRR